MEYFIRPDNSKEYFSDENCFILEALNHAGFNDFSIAIARVMPGQITEMHRLTATTEVYYILQGKGLAEINGKIKEVTAGDIVFIPPTIPQRITNIGDDELVFLCVCSPRFEQENYERLSRDSFNPL